MASGWDLDVPVPAGFGLDNPSSIWDSAGTLGGSSSQPGTASWWDRATDYLGSEKGSQALGKLGSSLLGTAGQANPAYLRIQAGAAPFSPGGGNSLLNTMLQMRLQQQQQRQQPLGPNFRASLLG